MQFHKVRRECAGITREAGGWAGRGAWYDVLYYYSRALAELFKEVGGFPFCVEGGLWRRWAFHLIRLTAFGTFPSRGRPLLCGILAAAAVWGLPPGKRDGMIHIKIGGCAVKTGLQTTLQYFYCVQNRKQQLDIEPAGWYTKDGQRKAATIEGG